MFLSRWEDESTRPALVAAFRAGLADEADAHVSRDHIQASFVSCLSRIVPTETERTPEFASLVRAQLTGLVLLRYVLPVEPLASQDFGELLKSVALAVDCLLDRPPDQTRALRTGRPVTPRPPEAMSPLGAAIRPGRRCRRRPGDVRRGRTSAQLNMPGRLNRTCRDVGSAEHARLVITRGLLVDDVDAVVRVDDRDQ
ncbi:hypothetical protein ACIP79_31210 [Streptomyces sp. NPDC088747]|uniref:TetR/AcrR family transcriptional regulator n=1 Tax=Streptomyces sp. NPDC088747 TaxID=3365886 RepID=UPI0038003D01